MELIDRYRRPARRLAVHFARGLKVILDQFGQSGEGRWEVVLAAGVAATVPMLISFFVGHQRSFVEGSPPPAARADWPAGPYQNDRSPPVSWLVRKLAKKKPK
jgi:hypothetical protein